jgi:hypothetical protein
MEVDFSKFGPKVTDQLSKTIERIGAEGGTDMFLIVGGQDTPEGVRTVCRFGGAVSPMAGMMLMASAVRTTIALLVDSNTLPQHVAEYLVMQACQYALTDAVRQVGSEVGLDAAIPDNVINLADQILARMKKGDA